MTPEVSLTVLKTFKGFIYWFTKLIACDYEQTNPSKVFKYMRNKTLFYEVICVFAYCLGGGIYEW